MTGVDKLQEGSKVEDTKVRREEFQREFMSPSRIFILRPIATSLLMVGHSAGGRGGIQAVAGFSAAGGGLSHHSGHHLLSRRQPGRDGVVGHGSPGAPVRPGAGAPADDLDQLRRQLHHHLTVQPQPEYRRGGAGSAAVDQCGGNLPASRPSHAAHLQQEQSCRCAGADPGAQLPIRCPCRKWRTLRIRAWRRRFPNCREWAW